PPCTGYYARVMGLPCAHVLHARIGSRMPLTKADVIDRWLLVAPTPPLPPLPPPLHIAPRLLLDPHVVQTRGRPPATGSSTRRDPSHFENAPPTASRRCCSRCGKPGHYARTCPDRQAAGAPR